MAKDHNIIFKTMEGVCFCSSITFTQFQHYSVMYLFFAFQLAEKLHSFLHSSTLTVETLSEFAATYMQSLLILDLTCFIDLKFIIKSLNQFLLS